MIPSCFRKTTFNVMHNMGYKSCTSSLLSSMHVNMARRTLSTALRWRIIGMHQTGMSFKAIGRQLGYHHSVISRLVQKYRQTNDVKDRPRSGQPRKTSQRDDRHLARILRGNPFATSGFLKRLWLPNVRLSNSTVRNRIRALGLRSRRVIKRPMLSDQHKRRRLEWCLMRQGWNMRTWRRMHWSDESRFLLYVTDGRSRVWRQPNTAYVPRNIKPTVPYGGGSVMIWGCVSHDCKLDLVTVRGNLNGNQYIRDILNPVLVPHFDNHPLATRPMFMDDNARPHRSLAVRVFLQGNAIQQEPWPAMSPDLNPIEHLWDFLGRRIQSRDPPVHTLAALEAALHEEWRQITQDRIRRLTGSVRRRVQAVIRARGGYTRY